MVVSNMFYIHLYLGKISNLTHIFQKGLVQPPTRVNPLKPSHHTHPSPSTNHPGCRSLELHGFGFGLWRFGWQHLLDFPRRYATGSSFFARGVWWEDIGQKTDACGEKGDARR